MIQKVLFVPYKIVGGKLLYLVGKRQHGPIWQFPTGHIADNVKGESVIDGVKREIKEELGITRFRNFINTNKSFTWTKDYQSKKSDEVRESIFAIDITGEKIKIEKAEFSGYKFLPLQEAKEILTFQSHQKIAEMVNKKVKDKNYSKIFIICGPGGSGKEAVLTELQKRTNLKRAKTITTRPKRPGESESGRRFVSIAEFKSLDKQGKLLEKNFFWGNWYGSIRDDIESEMEQGNDVLVELDLNGVKSLKKIYANVVAIFLTVDIKKLEARMRRRGGEDESRISERMEIARSEIKGSEICDYEVENREGEFERTVNRVEEIIKDESRGDRHGEKK